MTFRHLIIAIAAIALYLLPGRSDAAIRLLAVGIADYPGSSRDLILPANDARMIKAAYDAVAGVKSTLLLNEKATKTAIREAMTKMFASAKPEDTIVFFFSGHGYDGGFSAYDGHINYSEIKKEMAASKAKNKIVLADASFSGNMRRNSDTASPDKMKDANIMLFLSSRTTEQAIESPSMKNGHFAMALKEAFSGKADSNRDHVVTAKELFTYVSGRVKELSDDRQHPVMWGRFPDTMPVVRLK